MERNKAAKPAPGKKQVRSEQRQVNGLASTNSTPNQIIHLTAVAAVKAAATALLTNQIVRKVWVKQTGGENVNFTVEKCVIEPGSALCSIAGPREALTITEGALEVCVRVAWEAATPTSDAPIITTATENVLLIENITLPLRGSNLGSTDVIPISFYYVAPQSNQAIRFNLAELPRELLQNAVAEVLETVSPARFEAGVRVVVSLVGNNPTGATGPQLTLTQNFQTDLPPLVSSAEKVGGEIVTHFEESETGNLIFALDEIGAAGAPILFEETPHCFMQPDQTNENLDQILTEVNLFQGIQSLTLCGGINAVLALASGNLNQINAAFNPNFLVSLVQRRELDGATVQSLREVKTPQALLLLISRRRLGWMFDEICRLACLETRKTLKKAVRLEFTLFGSSGAVLGRACLEPGTFKL